MEKKKTIFQKFFGSGKKKSPRGNKSPRENNSPRGNKSPFKLLSFDFIMGNKHTEMGVGFIFQFISRFLQIFTKKYFK